MKSLIIFVLLAIQINVALGQVIDTKQYSEPNLKEGECHTLTDSKIYLSNVRKNSKTVSEIGDDKIDQLKNTDSESFFFCKVKCNLNSENHFVWITQKDQNENFKKMEGFVCHGLDIRDVAVTSTLTIKTTVATPYKAVQSRFSEIHQKLKSVSYKLTPVASNELLLEFYNNLRLVQGAYATASAPAFQGASAQLSKFLPDQPDSASLLKEKIQQLESAESLESPALDPVIDYTISESLVNMFLKMNGRFLSYIP